MHGDRGGNTCTREKLDDVLGVGDVYSSHSSPTACSAAFECEEGRPLAPFFFSFFFPFLTRQEMLH